MRSIYHIRCTEQERVVNTERKYQLGNSSITSAYRDGNFIEKDNPDAFQQTDLEQQLTSRQIGRVIIAGIRSDICIDATCRQAYSKNYEVFISKDGHSTYNTGLLKAEQIIEPIVLLKLPD